MSFQLYTGSGGNTGGIIASVSHKGAPPVSSMSIEGGGQISTITEFDDGGSKQVPVYAWVASAQPRVTLSYERGKNVIDNPPDSAEGRFVLASGGTTTLRVGGNLIVDPTNTKSVGTNGAQFSWLKTYSTLNNPFSN